MVIFILALTTLGPGLAVPAAGLPAEAGGAGYHPEHVAQGHLPGQRLHGGLLRAHESFEFFYYRDWDGVAIYSFMELLNEYIVFYNERRKKQSLGWMSPRRYRASRGLAA